MNRRVITHAVVILGLFVLAVAAYGVWYRHVAAVADKASALMVQIEEKNSDTQRMRDAKERLVSLGDDEAAVREFFVTTQDVVPFLEALETTGTALGTDVEVVSVAAVATPRERLNLSLRISGSFDAVMRTLGAIEHAPYDIEVQSVTIDTTGGTWSAAAVLAVGTTAGATTP